MKAAFAACFFQPNFFIMIKSNQFRQNLFGLSLLFLLLLLLLAACGGGEADLPEDAGEADTTELDSETIADGDIGATGSEEDSGEIPPTPQPGSKVEVARTTPDAANAGLIAANSTAPANRIETAETAVPLDIALVVDTTGSMANELANLQAALPELAASLASLPEATNLRLGLVTYGDQSKQDAIQLFEFTEDRLGFAENVTSLAAVGGGDYPEALADGLNRAISSLNWRTDARQMLILIADAPPQPGSDFAAISQQAAAQNITIFTIGSDGLDANGAAIFAQIAQTTNGRFFYITNSPDTSPSEATAVYTTTQFATALLDIVQEVVDE